MRQNLLELHRAVTWWQERSGFHPLSCSCGKVLMPFIDGFRRIVYLKCPKCGRRQDDWPHETVLDAYRNHENDKLTGYIQPRAVVVTE